MNQSTQAVAIAGALAPGTRLLEYRVERVLGTGGFGITYAAYDPHLRKTVAIKEYLPAELAVRQDPNTVSLRSPQARAAYAWGREQFIKEARLVALFSHPNLIHVYRYFEANETAYFVMDYAEGTTLEEVLKRQGTLSESSIRSILLPILEGLREVHRARVLHRDLKPSNIILRRDGTPVLIDFGSARHNVGSMTRSIMSVVTAGYAPIEQYAVDGHQGPWTDIYSAGAVCYRALSGKRPLDSVSRIRRDPLTPAVIVGRGKYSPHFLRAVDWALSVNPEERPVGIADWRQALEGSIWPPQRASRGRHTPSPPWPVLDSPEDEETQMLSDEERPELTLRLAPIHDAPAESPEPARTEVVSLAQLGLTRSPSAVRAPLAPEPHEHTAPTGGFPAEPRPRAPRWAWASLATTAILGMLALWVLQDARFPWARFAQAEFTMDLPRRPAAPPRAVPAAAAAAVGPGAAAGEIAPTAVRPVATMSARSVFRDCEGCPVMVVLPGGGFLMGSPPDSDLPDSERPARRVTLARSFAMGQFEVTLGQWQACAETGACAPIANAEGALARLPVVNVSYADAGAYAQWLSQISGRRYRLPTETEWEYAVRAGSTGAYFWSAANVERCHYANAADPGGELAGCDDGHARRAPVGSFLANPYGLFDMAGNTWEWTLDCWRDNYQGAPVDGSAVGGAPCARHVVRGGSWRSPQAELRSAARAPRETGARADDLGFRLVAE